MPFADMTLLAQGGDSSALIVFLVYTLAVFGLAAVSNYLMQQKSFLSEYFLGSRSLGVWAFALTFAATSASGGSFTGFPALIYSHGWILALWISSYMVFPLCTMGILGKRINQVARISGAITVPDVIRDRFRSPALGLLAVSMIVFFMSFNLVAQFKAGSKILITLLRNNEFFQTGVAFTSTAMDSTGLSAMSFFDGVQPAYLLCLLLFAVAVIAYTTYGGFHAVVWTDVMQGIVMVIGVMIMLPLAISQVGGIDSMSADISEMTPPRAGFVKLSADIPLDRPQTIASRWIKIDDADGSPRLLRINSDLTLPAGDGPSEHELKFVEPVTPHEVERQLARLQDERHLAEFRADIRGLLERQQQTLEAQAASDPAAATRLADAERALEELDELPLAALNEVPGLALTAEIVVERDAPFGAGESGVYVTGPGPASHSLAATAEAELDKGAELEPEVSGFLPFSLAVSFFFMWAISGTGQPSNMVRLMAFNNSVTLRRSIFTVTIYFSLIYFPLVVIFCCSRILIPGMELDADSIMPNMAVELTGNIGHGWLAGLLVAAPFAAIMSTVDSFLLMISSAIVRDIYQRNMKPDASEKQIKRLSYLCTLLVGTGAMLGAVNPPQFLQNIIVYVGSGLSAVFLGPVIFALFWPRMNKQGMAGGMLGGFTAHLSMYLAGVFVNGSFFKPWRPMGTDPIVVGLAVSFALTWLTARITPAPPQDLVEKYFKRRTPTA